MIEGIPDEYSQLKVIAVGQEPDLDAAPALKDDLVAEISGNCCNIGLTWGQVGVRQEEYSFLRDFKDFTPLEEMYAYLAVLRNRYPSQQDWGHHPLAYPTGAILRSFIVEQNKRNGIFIAQLDQEGSVSVKFENWIRKHDGSTPHISQYARWLDSEYPGLTPELSLDLLRRIKTPFDLYYKPFVPKTKEEKLAGFTGPKVKEGEQSDQSTSGSQTLEINRLLEPIQTEDQEITPGEELAFRTRFVVLRGRMKFSSYEQRARGALEIINLDEAFEFLKAKNPTEAELAELLKISDNSLYTKLAAVVTGEGAHDTARTKAGLLRSDPFWRKMDISAVILKLITTD